MMVFDFTREMFHAQHAVNIHIFFFKNVNISPVFILSYHNCSHFLKYILKIYVDVY